MRCNLCNKEDFFEFYGKARYSNNASWVICKNCGLVTNNSTTSKEVLLNTFKEESNQKFDGGAFDRYLGLAEERVKFAMPYLKKGMKGLEIGCGVGTFMNEIQKEDILMFGVEPEQVSAHIGRSNNLNIANCYFEDFKSIQTFDAIFLWNVLEHFEDINKTLEKVYSILKPNGKVFIIVPNIKRPYAKLSYFFTNTHKYYFSTNTLSSFLFKNGFGNITFSIHKPYGLLNCVATKDATTNDFLIFRDNFVNIIYSLYVKEVLHPKL